MSKKEQLNGMTREELKAKESKLASEIEQLKRVIEASNTTVFDILIGEVKKEMENNIAEEEWKILKENQKKIESYRSIEKTLQNQEELLDRKEEELEDVRSAIKYYQMTIFDQIKEEDKEIADTGYLDQLGQPIRTGDVYKSEETDSNDEYSYYLIKKSAEIDGSYSVISNNFSGEKLLQYERNRDFINNSNCVGNIYLEDYEQENALNGLRIITSANYENCEDEEGNS